MRFNVLKKQSTHHERAFYEVLKELKIPFKHRWLIQNREVDFLLWDKVCVEISGHPQNIEKNNLLVKLGYEPLHLYNTEVKNVEKIKKYLNDYKIKIARRPH